MSTATSEQNLYAVLGGDPSASQEQIREQYRVLVRRYHPDLHPGDANAAHMMEQVNAAYEVLGNPTERRD
jgi:molecular chaperone DnaJ